MYEFLETEEWKQLSRKIRSRDKHCLRCKSKMDLCADHIIPRSRRPDLQLEEFNLQTLCWVCNHAKSNIYIVCFLDQPSQRLVTEIQKEKNKSNAHYQKIARNYLFKKDKTSNKWVVDDKTFKKFEEEYVKLLIPGVPGQKEREGVLNAPLNVVRFIGMGFSAMGVVAASLGALGLETIAKYRISEKEISGFVEQQMEKQYSDWH